VSGSQAIPEAPPPSRTSAASRERRLSPDSIVRILSVGRSLYWVVFFDVVLSVVKNACKVRKEGTSMARQTIAGILGFVVAATIPIAGQNVHLKGGANAEPAFIDQADLTLNAQGSLAGLSNADVLVTLTATADVTATCTNQGGNAAPGQNPAPVTVSGSDSIPAEELKNGNTPFDVTTIAPVTPITGAPDCANPNWSEDITDLSFTSATITVEQPAGNVVLTVTCTFSEPTSNGAVPGRNVSCTSS
jgi:hypothetical protein